MDIDRHSSTLLDINLEQKRKKLSEVEKELLEWKEKLNDNILNKSPQDQTNQSNLKMTERMDGIHDGEDDFCPVEEWVIDPACNFLLDHSTGRNCPHDPTERISPVGGKQLHRRVTTVLDSAKQYLRLLETLIYTCKPKDECLKPKKPLKQQSLRDYFH